MTADRQKVVQYLGEAHATERALTRVLQEQIAVTPSGSYRSALETHLRETRDHSDRLRERLSELGAGRSPLAVAGVVVSSVVGQTMAIAKTPLNLIRGSGGEEKVLKNAKDSAASEALEIATYTALERLASDLGDDRTARLAREICADEQRMLDRIIDEIPQLAEKVVAADVRGNPSYDIASTGAGEAAREVVDAGRRAAATSTTKARTVARTARKVPGVARAEGELKGAVASADDLAIPGYGDLTAEEIARRLTQLSQIDLAKVDAYERRTQDRTTILERVESLAGDEPWAGYDEQNVQEIRKALTDRDAESIRGVAAYERRHKGRAGVLQATDSATVSA